MPMLRPHEAVRVDDAPIRKREQVSSAVRLSMHIDRRLEGMVVGATAFAISVVVDLHYPADRLPRSDWQFNSSFSEIFQIAEVCPGNRSELG